jgi:hypothetical protein
VIAQAEAGGVLTTAGVNVILGATVNTLDASVGAGATVLNATAPPVDYLRILAGYDWTLASGLPFQTRARATITLVNGVIAPGDTVTVTVPNAGAQVLTAGVSFVIDPLSGAGTAVNLAAAINAVAALTPGNPAPPQADGVRASASGAVVTLTATLGGNTGNTIALGTSNPAGFTLPATFAGGLMNVTTAAQNQANFGAFRHIPDVDSSLADSALNGVLSRLRDPALSLFGAANPEPVVQVYNGNGTVFV